MSGILFMSVATVGWAESPYKSMDYGAGEAEYLNSCATCHGTDATGSGPLAELLSVKVPDLTTLAQRSDGAFPMLAVIKVIDGREGVRSHGGPMPVWGERYFAAVDPAPGELRNELMVQGRVLALAKYLEGLQK